MKCVRFQRGLIVAKDIGSFFIYVDTRLTSREGNELCLAIACGYHMRSRLSVPHSQSIHPSAQDGVQTLESNGITSIHAGPPRKTHGTDFEKRHDLYAFSFVERNKDYEGYVPV